MVKGRSLDAEIPPRVDRLFREESGRMVAALTRILGVHNLDLAEDAVQDTLVKALEVWRYRGLPDDPAAWIVRAARNRAIDIIRRQKTFRDFAPDLSHSLKSEWSMVPAVDSCFLRGEIEDGQLRMMFSCCSPGLPVQSQVSLILKILCGFGVGEIASAFLSTPGAVERRINRARQILKGSGSLFELAGPGQVADRLESVQQAIYLLFNEGYHGTGSPRVIRDDLCHEALRLGVLLARHPHGGTTETLALVALMSFHAARLPSRIDERGCLIELEAQDRQRWDQELLAQGEYFLHRSATGGELTPLHLEAGIAALHASAGSLAATDWEKIVRLYEQLYKIHPSPIVGLNRALALGLSQGPGVGLEALETLPGRRELKDYPFLPAAHAFLLEQAGRHDDSRRYLQEALSLARTPAERQFFSSRLAALPGASA